MNGYVAIIGSGMMGSGIGAMSALAGHRTILVDTDRERAELGKIRAIQNIELRKEQGLNSIKDSKQAAGLLETAGDIGEIAGASLVIEAIVEDLEIKQQLFKQLDGLLPSDVPICSNTSGLRITDISKLCKYPERTVTTHFWLPAHLVPLVEVVMGDKTDLAVAENVRAELINWKKAPVLVKKDLPGQLANRIFQAIIRESIDIVASGLASAEDVDTAISCGMAMRFPVWGPLKHLDAIGLELGLAVQATVLPDICGDKKPNDYLQSLVKDGNLGAKTGQGFYNWNERSITDDMEKRDLFIIEAVKAVEATNKKQYFCVGTYTEPILFGTGEVFQGKGNGISICTFEDGNIETVSSVDVRNPSYLTIDKTRNKIYAVNEMKEYMDQFGGGMTQLSYGKDWKMEIEATCNIGGTDPCHILLLKNGELLSIANFANGTVTMLPVNKKGDIMPNKRKLFEHQGKSVHSIRQNGPHAHATIEVPGQQLFYVPDLGTDTVYAYRYMGTTVEPEPDKNISVMPGSGPRTGIFSKPGDDFYLICEISSQIIHFKYENGVMTEQETMNTLPDGNAIKNICSDIHLTPDGAYLFASNRGHDSIASFKVNEDGSLTLVERQSCRGKTPRNFAIEPEGKYLLCGNQDSDTITVFAINPDGTLNFVREEVFGTPVCIRFFDE